MYISLAQINPTVGDLVGNTRLILQAISKAKAQHADMVVFPELVLSGYPANDFLLLPDFIAAHQSYLAQIIAASSGIIVILGLARPSGQGAEKLLYNSAAVIQNQSLLGYQDKSLLPTYDVFDERRYFEPAASTQIWKLNGQRVGITICEDIWQHSKELGSTSYSRDPVQELLLQKPDFVINLSASPYSLNKFSLRLHVCQEAVKTLHCPFLLCNQVGGNDSLIFDGHSLYIDALGHLVAYGKGFCADELLVDTSHKAKGEIPAPNLTESLYQALVVGVRDYFHKLGFQKACLGLSGGIDSALVACIAVEALGSDHVMGVAMPSRYSSESSLTDARQLAHALEIECKEISIEKPFQTYLDLLEPHFDERPIDVTEENLQARIRGMLLMAFSNKFGYIVLSTGNKSELAMGYATLYGDMCGGLAILSDVSKKQVYMLSEWINRDREIIPWNTIRKPPSAELRFNQKDSDSLPDYEIVDNVLEAYVEFHWSPTQIARHFAYSLEVVEDLIRRIHRNEYKRRQSPMGFRVTEKDLLVGRRFPIVQRWVN